MQQVNCWKRYWFLLRNERPDNNTFPALVHCIAVNTNCINHCSIRKIKKQGRKKDKESFHLKIFGNSRYLYKFDIKMISN
jgi:hypothetical protein